ncbi:copper/silver efflux system outer membrane protein CusC [Klebsiella michiganensis]|nr:copper/silver efflux system outer membrane protein CusC [Klebsiella michiganensis]
MAALKVEEAGPSSTSRMQIVIPAECLIRDHYSGGLKGDKPTTQKYDAGLELRYELDFFGKLKNMSDADRQNYFASEEARRAVLSCWSPAFHKAISASNGV